MRFDTSVPLKSRKRLELGNFRGVDLTSSPLQVSTSRAAESYNLILENGINRKRPGWESLLDLGERINGIFPYVLDGYIQNYQSVLREGSEVLLVHAGSTLYLVSEDYRYQLVLSGALPDRRSLCFYRNNKAFVAVGGEIWVFGAHDEQASCRLKQLQDIAYVPTTTININEKYTEGRSSKDAVNMLTPWRKNEITLPDVGVSESWVDTWFKLDGYIDENTVVDIVVPLNDEDNPDVKLEEDEKSFSLNGLARQYILEIRRSPEFYDGAVLNFRFSPDAWQVIKGHTVVVQFSSTTAGHLEKITNCRFGAAFGVGGKADRLFLSGNPKYPNRDWWSEYDDFTYFPDGNTMEVGSSGSKITGYARLSDNTMAVFKDGAVGDATIYYRTGKTVTVTDETDFSHEEAIFPAVAGTAGEGLLTPFGVANLAGDVLMLGREGVYGIELSQNVASVERYQRERSRAILGDLCRRSFSDAAMAVHKGRLYLAPHDGSGICYVADSRYRASFEGADAGYEWWVWDHIPARVFAVYQNQLLFGDDKGRICVFKEGTFTDRARVELADGDIGAMDENGTFTYGTQIKPKNGDRIVTDSYGYKNSFYAKLLDNAQIIDDVKIKIPDDENVYLQTYDGMELWADHVGDSGLDVGKAYFVRDFDIGALTFSLSSEKVGAAVKLSAGGFRLSVQCTEAVICDVDATNQRFNLKAAGGSALPVIRYNDKEPGLLNPRLIETTPVVATWLSGMYDLGTYMDRKTLLGISVATGAGCGTVEFGYETARNEAAWQARGIKGFDFNDIDFDNFTFLAPFAGSVTKRMNVRNFNFIRFLYRSEGDEDCAVAGMTVLYKINQTNRGMF